MIKNISHISIKSFDDYSFNDDFKKINIFFGTNGSGKTALAKGLVEELGDESRARVFSSEYVRDNILVQDEIAGVKLTVGQKAVANEENIKNINDANDNISKTNQRLENSLESSKKNLYQILQKTLEDAKKQFDLSKQINQKQNAKDNPTDAYKLWLEGIDNDKNVREVDSSEGLESLIDKLQIENGNLMKIPGIDKSNFDQISSLLSKEVVVPSESISILIKDWITEGLHVHNMDNDSEICAFCGNEFNGPNISKSINDKISTEHSQLIEVLRNNKNILTKLEESLLNIQNYIDIDNAKKGLAEIKSAIDNKIENTNKSISFEIENFNYLLKIQEEVKNKISYNSEEINNLSKQLAEIEHVAKSWIGKQLKENSIAKSFVEDINSLKRQISDNQKKIEKNRNRISELQEISSDLRPFKDLVNYQFELIGFDFALEIMSDNQHYLVKKRNSTEEIKKEDLSEGELRLLGFLHFYYDLFEVFDESFVSNLELVIIDDPITSLDNDNRYYLTGLINDLIKKFDKHEGQLFLFTHSSLDFHNIGYRANKEYTRWFNVYKNFNSNSEIKIVSSDERKNYSDDYQTKFREVFAFASLSRKELLSHFLNGKFISYGNKARLVFESHARTHYKIDTVTTANKNKIMKFYEIPSEEEHRLELALDVINSLSHGSSFTDENQISVSEVQTMVRFLMQILHYKDKYHVIEMVGDLINHNNKDSINSWLIMDSKK